MWHNQLNRAIGEGILRGHNSFTSFFLPIVGVGWKLLFLQLINYRPMFVDEGLSRAM